MTVEQLVGDGEAEHRVAEELQALVGGKPTVLVGVAAVGQRQRQQLVGQLDAQRLGQGFARSTHGRSGVWSENMPESLAHRGSICSWWWPGSASASGTPQSGHNPGQSGRHTGDSGNSNTTVSISGCSRSIVPSTIWPI